MFQDIPSEPRSPPPVRTEAHPERSDSLIATSSTDNLTVTVPAEIRSPDISNAVLKDQPGLRYGNLPLATRYLLSPLAGFTNLPFRRIVRSLGGLGLATTDLVNAKGLLRGGEKTMSLIETTEDDTPYSVQLFGTDPIAMAEAARFVEEYGADSVDINMGCPVHRIAGSGAGAGMMRCPDDTLNLVRAVVEAVRLPVTVKMRLGWDDRSITAPFFAREFEEVGVVAIAIHGRTREQGFSGVVNRDGIRQVVEAVERIPVIGNGDIRNVADAERMFRETGCDGISIGRGALANPWIFRQLAEWEATGTYAPAGNFDDRLGLLKRQFGYVEDRFGFEKAIVYFRKMAHWYLKGMRVRARLRHEFQQVRTREDLDTVLRRVTEEGPIGGNRHRLPELHVPVPSGPNAHW